jgi:hypothetical protein
MKRKVIIGGLIAVILIIAAIAIFSAKAPEVVEIDVTEAAVEDGTIVEDSLADAGLAEDSVAVIIEE